MKKISYQQCIQKLNPGHLKKIAETYQLVFIPFSSEPARGTLIKKFTQPHFVDECLTHLTDDQKNALMVITLYAQYIPSDEINAIVRRVLGEGIDYMAVITSLLDTGLIFHVFNNANEKAYYLIPVEASKSLLDCSHILFTGLCNNYRSDTEMMRIHTSGSSLYLSVFAAFGSMLGNDLKFNMDNTLNRRTILKLKPNLGVESGMLDYETLEQYCNVIVSFIYALDVIERGGTEITLRVNASERWAALMLHEKRQSFFNFLRDSVFKEVHWHAFLLILSLIPENMFLHISLLEKFYRIFFDSDVHTGHGSFEKKPFNRFAIFLLYQLGIIEFASQDVHSFCAWKVTHEGMMLLRGTSNGETVPSHLEENQIIIQPNYELIIPRNADPSILWKIYRFADIYQCEYLLRFHISRDSVHRGLAANLSSSDIIDLLELLSKEEIPQNVTYSLKEWCEEYGAVYFMDVFLLRCKSKHLAEQIKLHPKTKPYIKGDFSETDLIADRTEYEELYKQLKALDLTPLKRVVVPHEQTADEPQSDFLLGTNAAYHPVFKQIHLIHEQLRFLPDFIL